MVQQNKTENSSVLVVLFMSKQDRKGYRYPLVNLSSIWEVEQFL